MQESRPALSKTEWKIMNLCWSLDSATARQVYEASLVREKREYRTVKTLLDRIVKKGYLEVRKLGPLCIYTPGVTKRQALRAAIDEFVDIVLDRSLAPLFVHLADREELDEDELEGLKQLIDAGNQSTEQEDGE